MNLEHFEPSAFAARRAALAARVNGQPVVVCAGQSSPRNYPSNAFAFRASSHFLYLIGAPIEGAVAVLEAQRCTVYVNPPTADGALWHGPQPSLAQLGEQLGVSVQPLAQLEAGVPGGAAALLAQDAASRARLRAVLGREVEGREAPGIDEVVLDAVIALRLIHDEAAIAGLRRAAEASVAAHLAGMAATQPGRREWEVQAAMEGELMRRGMGCAYPSIVTVHGEVLHNHAHHHTLAVGDLLLADVGAETPDGWAGDITRTWPVSGAFSSTQRDIYEVVLAAQRAAIDAARPGTRYRDLHLTACGALAAGMVDLGILRGDPSELTERGAHALLFPHGVGHLIGLDVHDMEDLGDRAGYAPGRTRSQQFGLGYLRLDRDLEPGMAVTIEPGFYLVPAILEHPELQALADDVLDRDRLAQFADVRGIRIEDDILITAQGCEVLTAELPKASAEVEARVG